MDGGLGRGQGSARKRFKPYMRGLPHICGRGRIYAGASWVLLRLAGFGASHLTVLISSSQMLQYTKVISLKYRPLSLADVVVRSSVFL